MSVTYLDPRSKPGLPVDPYSVKGLATETPAVIGMLANGFPDSIAFLDEVEAALLPLLPNGSTIRRYAKPNASVVVSDATLQAMGAECDAVVAAYGH